MKKWIVALAVGFLFLNIPVTAGAANTLIPVGQVVGLELQNNTVTVAAFEGDSCAKRAGLEVGDRLLTIDDRQITCSQDVHTALEQSQGSVRIQVQRGESVSTLRVEPAITPNGPKLGIYLRQGVTGIGTVTYYDPESKTFAALGHGINDSTGQLLTLTGREPINCPGSPLRPLRTDTTLAP